MTEGPIAVIDNTHEDNAVIGPATELYLYESASAALDAHPEAIARSMVERGDTLDKPIIWPFEVVNL